MKGLHFWLGALALALLLPAAAVAADVKVGLMSRANGPRKART